MNLWDEEYTPWKNKSQFLNWIRGGLRRLWSRHPARTELKNRNRKKLPNEKGRDVWHNQCAICEEWKKSAEVEVDHIIPNPPFTELEHIHDYTKNLLTTGWEGLQLICKPCHKIKTYAERYGCTFEQAKERKAEIARRKK